MRKTGIDIIGDAPWGTHFCQFYGDREDLISILVPYFIAGLENNEFCMWVTSSPLTDRQAKAALHRALPGFDDYLARGQIEVLPYSRWYLRRGQFDMDRVLNGWVEKLEQALSRGFDGLRASGNTAWLEKRDWKDFTDYEEAINTIIGRHRMMALCTYSLEKCTAVEILDIIRNHQFALIRSDEGWDLIEASSLKQAREKVRESERRYQTLFSAMSEGFAVHEIICDARGVPYDYRFLEVNPAFERLTGLKREDVVGRTVKQVLPGIEPVWIETYGEVALSGRATYVEHRADALQKEYGVIAYAPATGQFATLFLDITDRKRREEALLRANTILEQRVADRTSELRQASLYARNLIEASLDPLVTVSPEGTITDVNKATELATGLGRESLIGSHFSAHFTDPDKANAGYQKVISEGQVRDYPLTIRQASGRTIDVLYNATVYRNECGSVEGVFAAARDVTELKAAQERRDFTNSLLELFALKSSSREYLDAAVEVIRNWSQCDAVGIRIADNNREIPFASHVGFSREFLEFEDRISLEQDHCVCVRAVTQKIEPQERSMVTPAGSFHCPNTAEFVESLSAKKRLRYRGKCVEFGYQSLVVIPIRYGEQVLGAIHLADHRPGRFSVSAVALLESLAPLIGEAIHRFHAEAELARYRDHLEELVKQRTGELQTANSQLQTEIAERRRAEETLRVMAEELARSNRDLEQFAYVASHDLQEPLRAVAGYVDLLRQRYSGKLDKKALQFITGAADGAARMQTLIVDLLAYSRVGTQVKSFQRTDLNPVLNHALDSLKVSLREAGAKVTAEVLPVLDVDPTQIAQLFQNLIGNAIKFRSRRSPEIHVGARKRRGSWLFSVRDNGIGVALEYRERIFLIFQRLHTRVSYPGTGIGLAICKKIVERHGGDIWVESEPEKGSVFYFTIPLRKTSHG